MGTADIRAVLEHEHPRDRLDSAIAQLCGYGSPLRMLLDSAVNGVRENPRGARELARDWNAQYTPTARGMLLTALEELLEILQDLTVLAPDGSLEGLIAFREELDKGMRDLT
jgi:hypothetical protein